MTPAAIAALQAQHRRALRFTVPGPVVPFQRVGRSADGRAYVPASMRKYKKHAATCALAARLRDREWANDDASRFAVSLVIYRLPEAGKARRGDVDNAAKTLLDAFGEVLYRDDSQVRELAARIVHCAPGRERVEVVVEQSAVEVET
jgi:Holliday junction resolvase RusA-like endonuclease